MDPQGQRRSKRRRTTPTTWDRGTFEYPDTGDPCYFPPSSPEPTENEEDPSSLPLSPTAPRSPSQPPATPTQDRTDQPQEPADPLSELINAMESPLSQSSPQTFPTSAMQTDDHCPLCSRPYPDLMNHIRSRHRGGKCFTDEQLRGLNLWRCGICRSAVPPATVKRHTCFRRAQASLMDNDNDTIFAPNAGKKSNLPEQFRLSPATCKTRTSEPQHSRP